MLSFPQFSFRAPALRSPCPLTPHARPAPIASTGQVYADKSSAFSIGYGQPDNPFCSSLIQEDGGMERALRFSAVPTHCCAQVFPSTCPESKACALFAPKHRGGGVTTGRTLTGHGSRVTGHELRIAARCCRPRRARPMIEWRSDTGGDTVSTEAVAPRRHAGTHLAATWWKLELPTTTWHLLLN